MSTAADPARLGHVVAMRFGIGVFDPAWLEYRLRLFRATMLPSLRCQHGHFRLVVMIDRQMPAGPRKRLEALLSDVASASVLELELHCDRHRVLGEQGRTLADANAWSHLVTTRIDDDDCLSPYAFAAIENAALGLVADGHDRAGIVIDSGLRYYPIEDMAFASTEQGSSVGTSLLTLPSDPETIFSFNHRRIGEECEARGWPMHFVSRDIASWLYLCHRYSDEHHAKRLEKLSRKRAAFRPSPDDLAGFPLDHDALREWLDHARSVPPLTEGAKTTHRLAEVEAEIERHRALAASQVAGDAEQRAALKEIEALHAERRRIGTLVASRRA